MKMRFSASFVTPSYSGDLERCRLLVQSRKICVPDIEHYVVVDHCDLDLFKPLGGSGTYIVDSRELLDPSFHKLPGQNTWWWSFRTPPLRGWMTQQLRKLAMPRIVSSDVLINLDSDVVFVKPFDLDLLFSGQSLGLFEVGFRNEETTKWADIAASMLGIETPKNVMNYVGMMIPWWRDNVLSMTNLIEENSGLAWQTVIGRNVTVSEYMLYGIYVKEVLGLENSHHFADQRPLIYASWDKEHYNPTSLARLFGELPEEAVGVMVHSKERIEPSVYVDYARAHWNLAERTARPSLSIPQ